MGIMVALFGTTDGHTEQILECKDQNLTFMARENESLLREMAQNGTTFTLEWEDSDSIIPTTLEELLEQ